MGPPSVLEKDLACWERHCPCWRRMFSLKHQHIPGATLTLFSKPVADLWRASFTVCSCSCSAWLFLWFYCSSRSAGPETLQQGCGLLVHRCHHLHIVSRSWRWPSSWGVSAPAHPLFSPPHLSTSSSIHLQSMCTSTCIHTHTHTHTHTHAHSSRGSCPDRHLVIKTEFSANPLCSHTALLLSASHPHLLYINVPSPTLWNEQLKREETS